MDKIRQFLYVYVTGCSVGFHYPELIGQKVLCMIDGEWQQDILKVKLLWTFRKIGRKRLQLYRRICVKDVMVV